MKNKKYLFLLLIIVPIIIFFVARSFSLEYTQEIKNVEIESDDYDDPGSFHIDKSAKWVSFSEAEVNFDLNTIYKESEGANYKDVIIVMDISGSMSGTKLDKAKSDAMELVGALLSNQNNHVALITFDTSSEIISGFTNNKNEMISMIENLTTKGCTNYNSGLLNVLEVMENYQKDDSHDLVALFLTDGFPNEDIPNQIATYNIIKDKYPYMTINGIQYEMGRDIIQEIIDISDNQWVANQETLNGVLFDAVITPLPYETFVVSDYIYKDYFYLDSISDVAVSRGTVALQEENGLQKIVWTLDDNLTGFNANMKIKLQLKSEYHNTRGFYPTNDHEAIDYKIIDDEEDNVNSTLTPVLKSTYNVIYDANAPEGCTLPDIPSEEHYVYETVSKRTETPVCEGYIFNGYQFDSNDATDITIINDDTFVMPGHDVIVRGTWAQQGIIKSMDGTVHEKLEGTLMKHNQYYSKTFGKSINRDSFESITTVDNIDVPANAIDSWDVSQEKNGSVIAWYIDNDSDNLYELYIGQEDGVKANPDSSYAFYYFRKAEVINLTNYDISDVTNMSYMFSKAGYNSATLDIINISDWDTTKVIDMSFMFDQTGYNATTFDIGDLSDWNTSSVTTMKCMFQAVGYKATTWDIGDISDWNTINVTDMTNMFSQTGYNATTFNLDLGGWNTSSVTTMKSMFNQTGYSATTWSIGDLSDWNTVNVTDMGGMFNASGYKATTWDIGDISEWNTSNVTNMNGMFSYVGYNTTTFDIGNLSEWDTSKVTNMYSMFYYAGYKATTWDIGDLSGWDTSKVTSMSSMFTYAGYSATTFDIDLSGWNTSQVNNMSNMFTYAGFYATTWSVGDLSEWDTSQVTNMSYMFSSAGRNATTFDIGDLSEWDTSQVTDMSNMFSSAGRRATTWNIGDLGEWDTSKVTNMSYMFSFAGYNATTFNLNLSGWDTSKVTSMSSMFSSAGYNSTTWSIGDLSGWKTGNVTNMSSMFASAGYNATTFDIGDLSGWDTSSVTNMSSMFSQTGYNATTFELDLTGWNTSQVTSIGSMFASAGYNATTWSIGDLSGWKTGNVTNMNNMFNKAGYNATTFYLGDLSNWDTSKVTAMQQMFLESGHEASTWYVGKLSGWVTSSVTNMTSLFNDAGANAEIFELDLTNWDVSSVTSMNYLFYSSGRNATTWKIGDLSNWNTSSVTNMDYMFNAAGKNAEVWENIGTLKVYNARIADFFSGCNNARATINIYSDITVYSYAFYNAATVQGSGITVNYSSATTNIDRIIGTKSSSSNVVKGDQLD